MYVKGVRWSMFFEERVVIDLMVIFIFKIERERGGFDGVDGLFSDCCYFRKKEGFGGV
jgi:hypothetical protein